MSVELVWHTPDAEKLIAYCARVSAYNQTNPEYEKLIKYLIEHKHWSPFEMADMCVEINTSRVISQQILRHRSFHFQEFSQRYAPVDMDSVIFYEGREQDLKNRQNSTDTLDEGIKEDWEAMQIRLYQDTMQAYQWALDNGIAKECARFILPGQTRTKVYMKGTVRDWIHYINLRTGNGTQIEHIEIAEQIKTIFTNCFPTVAKVAFKED